MWELKQVLHDVRADKRCRIIAHAIAKTNMRAAIAYASGFNLRSMIVR